MAKTDYITSSDGRVRLYVYQSDIQNSTAADPYVNVTVYLQVSSFYSGKNIWVRPTISASLLSGAYTYSSSEVQYFAPSGISGWKTLLTLFSSKGIWSVSKTRTSFAVSFSCADLQTDNGHQYNVSLSGTVTMQAWPVSGTKDTMSVTSSMTMGSSYTISITHKTSGNKNTLTWKFGSQSGTLLSNSTSTSVTFSPSMSLGAQIPSASSGTVTFTLSTYNSAGTSLGSSTYTSTLNVPSYSISTPTVSAAKNSYTGIGVYVANKTQTRFTLSGLPSGSYGATVSGSYVIKLAGTQQTSGTKSGTSSSNVDYTAAGTGALQLTYTVKDSRGKTASASASVTYVANAAPTISFSAARDASTPTNWSGTATGTYLNVSGNTATITFTEGTAGTNTASGGTVSRTVSGTCAETSTLSIKATITDSLGNTASRTISIATVFAYLEATPNRVISIGRKASTDISDKVQIGLPVDIEGVINQLNGGEFNQYGTNGVIRTKLNWGDIYTYNASGTQGFHVNGAGNIYPNQSSNYINDFVIAQGTSGGWRYRKWNSKFYECWYTISATTKSFSAWGTVYASASTSAITYPTTFSSAPWEIAIPSGGTNSVWLDRSGANTTTKSATYEGIRPVSGSANFGIILYVAGISST